MFGGWFNLLIRRRKLKKHLERMEEAEERALMPSEIKPDDKPIEVRGTLTGDKQPMDDFLKAMGIKK